MPQGDAGDLLIVDAEVGGVSGVAVRCRGGRITAVGRSLATGEESVLDARGGALIPGLHDHHIHLFAPAGA